MKVQIASKNINILEVNEDKKEAHAIISQIPHPFWKKVEKIIKKG